MTRKKFRRHKRQNVLEKSHLNPELEKPEWADPDKVEVAKQTWRTSFLSQFPWYKPKVSI